MPRGAPSPSTKQRPQRAGSLRCCQGRRAAPGSHLRPRRKLQRRQCRDSGTLRLPFHDQTSASCGPGHPAKAPRAAYTLGAEEGRRDSLGLLQASLHGGVRAGKQVPTSSQATLSAPHPQPQERHAADHIWHMQGSSWPGSFPAPTDTSASLPAEPRRRTAATRQSPGCGSGPAARQEPPAVPAPAGRVRRQSRGWLRGRPGRGWPHGRDGTRPGCLLALAFSRPLLRPCPPPAPERARAGPVPGPRSPSAPAPAPAPSPDRPELRVRGCPPGGQTLPPSPDRGAPSPGLPNGRGATSRSRPARPGPTTAAAARGPARPGPPQLSNRRRRRVEHRPRRRPRALTARPARSRPAGGRARLSAAPRHAAGRSERPPRSRARPRQGRPGRPAGPLVYAEQLSAPPAAPPRADRPTGPAPTDRPRSARRGPALPGSARPGAARRGPARPPLRRAPPDAVTAACPARPAAAPAPPSSPRPSAAPGPAAPRWAQLPPPHPGHRQSRGRSPSSRPGVTRPPPTPGTARGSAQPLPRPDAGPPVPAPAGDLDPPRESPDPPWTLGPDRGCEGARRGGRPRRRVPRSHLASPRLTSPRAQRGRRRVTLRRGAGRTHAYPERPIPAPAAAGAEGFLNQADRSSTSLPAKAVSQGAAAPGQHAA